jgi:hypothetical protein
MKFRVKNSSDMNLRLALKLLKILLNALRLKFNKLFIFTFIY